MQSIYAGWLILSTIGMATNDYSNVGPYVSAAQNMAGIAPAAVWALVALISVIGLAKLYVDKSKDEADLKTIIASSVDAIAKNTTVLDKLSDKIDRCPNNDR